MNTKPEKAASLAAADPPPQAWHEATRLAALRQTRIVGSPSDPAFDEIVRVAALVCRAPVALVSLVEDTRQWFKARHGTGLSETPIESSVCATAIRHGGVFVVGDLRSDPRFAEMAIVKGEPGFRFYAGAPIVTAQGLPLGTVCVLDHAPRPAGLTAEQEAMLTALASQARLLIQIGERDRELELRRSTLLRLVARSPIGLAQTNLEGQIAFANEEFAGMTGRSAEALTGRRLRDLLHPDDAKLHDAAVNRAIEGEGYVALEARIVDEHGTLHWAGLHVSALSDADGTPAAVIFVGREITDRLRAAAALAASERKFRAITDAMPQMVWSTLPDGTPDYFNERWFDFTGEPADASFSDRWGDLVHADDRERSRERWEASLASGEDYEVEYRLRHRSGDHRWVLARAQPIRGATGEIERWFGTCTDIQDIKAAEEGRLLLAGELSHRIKNIFTVVGGLVSLTARGDDKAQDFAKGFRDRLGALAAAHEYVRPDSLAAGMLDSGQSVKGLLSVLLKPYTAHTNNRFQISGPDAPIGPKTAAALALIMHEQATNAVKYGALSNDDGRVEIRTEEVGETFVMTWCEIGGPSLKGPPEKLGFGTGLAARSAAGQLSGRIEHLWERDGLVMRLTVLRGNLQR